MTQPYAMFAVEAGGPETFKERSISSPSPGKGEALIRQTAIGLNFIDVYQRTGLYPVPGGWPAILGSEGAGIVEALGEGVQEVSVGERVAYTTPFGGYSSHRIVASDRLVKIPSGVTDEQAAAVMLKGLTADYLIHDCHEVKKGEAVLFHAAAGGVGSLAGQWLKAKGAIAIGTVGGEAKAALAREAGYAHVIDYEKEDFVERVSEITRGKGVVAAYDSVGKNTYPGSLKCIETFGTFVSFGQSSGVPDFKLADLAANGSLFATRPTLFHFIATRPQLEARAERLFSVLRSGEVKIRIAQTYPLREAAKAHADLEARKTTGQTVLIP